MKKTKLLYIITMLFQVFCITEVYAANATRVKTLILPKPKSRTILISSSVARAKTLILPRPKIVRMSPDAVAHTLSVAGFPEDMVPVMTCLAQYESSFRPLVTNRNKNGTTDYGLLQINEIWLKDCRVTSNQLKNPYINAKCALRVYQKQGLNAWVAFKKHRRQCLKYQMAQTHNTPVQNNEV
jgi:C-type lysozyme/alpha-lactalbumin family